MWHLSNDIKISRREQEGKKGRNQNSLYKLNCPGIDRKKGNQIMGVARLVFCRPPLVYKDENLKCLGSTLTSIRETGEKV